MILRQIIVFGLQLIADVFQSMKHTTFSTLYIPSEGLLLFSWSQFHRSMDLITIKRTSKLTKYKVTKQREKWSWVIDS